jgi:hypothetical protein
MALVIVRMPKNPKETTGVQGIVETPERMKQIVNHCTNGTIVGCC